MPNQNPAGINQPLNQHPLPSRKRLVVGIDGRVVPALGADVAPVDTLIIAAPAAGSGLVVEVTPPDGGGSITITTPVTDLLTAALVYKDGKGNEAVLFSDGGGVVAPGSLNMGPPCSFFLTEDDAGGGIYLRLTAGAPVADVSAVAQWTYVRGVERYVTSLLDSVKTGLLPAIPYGEALLLALDAGEEGIVSCYLLNYDTAPHGALVVASVVGNGGEAPIPTDIVGGVAVGDGDPIFDGETPTGYHGRGGNLNLIDTAGVATKAPVVMTAVTRTNLGPVRPDQGGAY